MQHIYNTEEFRKSGHELIDLLADYMQDAMQEKTPVLRWETPDNQLEFWRKYDMENGEVMTLFKDILDRSISLHHPKYMGHQISPTAPVSALSALLSAFMNNGMGVYEMGPASTAIEKVVAETFAKAIGYDQHADGFLTSGGTLANLTALLTARSVCADTDVWQTGHSGKKLAIMVSSEAHYCVDRAARIMGMGDEGIVKIETNDRFQMQTDRLETQLKKAEQKGLQVIAIVGSACTTSTGSYDDLDAIADFAARHKIWFHVDGAHGGAVVFSEKYKSLAKGIHRADSVVIDCHKMLMTPSITTALIFKKSNNAYKTFNQKAQYLWKEATDEEWYNLAKRTFECTKEMMSIKFFCLIKMYGIEELSKFVDTLYDLGDTFAKLIKERPNFELATPPECNIVCFRIYNPQLNIAENNTVNSNIRQQIVESGTYYIVQTTLKETVYLRTTLMNPMTTKTDLEGLLDEIETLYEQAYES